MLKRILLFCLTACAAAGKVSIVERPAAETLYALGDIHGDYDRMVTLLKAAHILEPGAAPADVRWTAGKATLVITGDMIDKGPRAVDVIHLLIALKAQAAGAGGEVILLSGNHEAEFLAGPDPKKAADFISDLEKKGYSVRDLTACKTDLGEFLCALPYGAKVGDWFFSHGGNTAGQTIPQLTAAIDSGKYKVTDPDSILEARLGENNPKGKPWIAAPDQRALLQRYADALGVKHMVQGHQPGAVPFNDGVTRKSGQIFGRWGLLYLIDVGMSRGVGNSQGALLKTVAGKVTAIYPDGSERPVETSK